jgi:TBC1 domain family member 13
MNLLSDLYPYQESLRRILIIFSKLNPSVRYVQGMNEVLAPLFYVFNNDPDTSNLVRVSVHNRFSLLSLLLV